MKKIVLKIIIPIASIALTVSFLELLASSLNPIIKPAHRPITVGIGGQEVLEYPSGYIKDRDLFWKLEPSYGEYNSKGLRDTEFLTRKEKNVLRIICLGDSITFGWPTKMENTYPKLLEEILKAHFTSMKFEVLNAGVPGYTSFQGKLFLEKEILRYRPDLIIVYYGINDEGGSYKPDKEQTRLPLWLVETANYLRRFQFYRLSLRVILNLKYPRTQIPVYPFHRVSPEDYRENLRSIKKIAEDRGIKTLFIIHPVFYDPEKGTLFTNTNYTPPADISQFDIYSIFKKREKYAHALFIDDCRPFNFHLTDDGQRILAEEICNFLIIHSFFYS